MPNRFTFLSRRGKISRRSPFGDQPYGKQGFIKAASDCHKIFESYYDANKHCFISILKEIGLGIGLDYGLVQVVQIGGEVTVVGTPVVYACRMGGAEARHTYINQPAFEQLFEKYSAIFDFDPREIDIKPEGKTLAYSVEPNGKEHKPSLPEWCTSKASKKKNSN